MKANHVATVRLLARIGRIGCIGMGAACDSAAPDNNTAPAESMSDSAARSMQSAMQPKSSPAAASGGSAAPATASRPATMGMSMDTSMSMGMSSTKSTSPTDSQPKAAGTGSQQGRMSDAGTAAAGSAAAMSGNTPDASVSSALPDLCSGCAQEPRDTTDMTVHLHHVHLNVKNREQSLQFYEKHFHAQRVLLNGTTEALHVAPTLLLLDEQPSAPDGTLPSALQHMGWGSADPGAWYQTAHAQGIEPDTRGFTLFNTNETPTIGEAGSGALLALTTVPVCFPIPDALSYIYVLGPDDERIEVWSGVDGRVNHLHFTTPDLAATSSWYQRFLGLPIATPLLSYQFFVDDIVFFYEAIGAPADYEKTDDHALGHVALAVTDLAAWQKRVQEQNIEVVSEPAAAHGFTSFFVRGPDGLLIELVQATKYPELCPMRM